MTKRCQDYSQDDSDRCEGRTKRRGVERRCAQKGIFTYQGKLYCWYHNPQSPKKFGEGYVDHRRLA
jgi:hypothetical protein